MPQHISGLSQILEPYALLLCDIWGVLHNGVRAFPQACHALQQARQQQKTVILISNAPRPHEEIIRQLAGLKVPRTAFDAIVTSGDVSRHLIRQRRHQALFHLGPARDESLFREDQPARTRQLDQAEYVVCTGLYDDDTETPDDYEDLLQSMRARNLPFICSNPDMVVEKGSRLIYCAGALAARYHDLGGEVIYAGKPYAPIYDMALEQAPPVPRHRILAIGDGHRTDLTGASGQKLDALFIARGIHAEETHDARGLNMQNVKELVSDLSHPPRYVQSMLCW